TQSFTLTVTQGIAFTSASSATFGLGSPGSFTVSATGFPAPTFTESGALPAGVSLSGAGVLSGTPTSSGSFPITITAGNGVAPSATQSFTLTVQQPPAFTSATSATFRLGARKTVADGASGVPAPT